MLIFTFKSYYWETLTFTKLRFSELKRAPTHTDIIEFSNFLLQLKNQRSVTRTVWLFYYFNFERNYDVLKPTSPRNLLNENVNFDKNETESKMENPTQIFFWQSNPSIIQIIKKKNKKPYALLHLSFIVKIDVFRSTVEHLWVVCINGETRAKKSK